MLADRHDRLYGEQYARLPEDLLAELLSAAPKIAAQVRNLLGPALAMKDRLQQAAEDLERIASAPPGSGQTVCSVDGGFAVERTVAVDIALSVAVGVEGFAPAGGSCAWDDNQYSSAYQVLTHDLENERLARGAMVILELDVLADAPHEFRIYDGSHLTPIIQLNSALTSRSPVVTEFTAELGDKHDLRGAFAAFATDPNIVAMPKYDSSRELCNILGAAIGERVPGDDKYLTSLILRGGQFTTPEQVPKRPWQLLHFTERESAAGPAAELARDLDEALQPLQNCQLYSLYFRPDDVGPAYRVEVKPELAHDPDRLTDLLSTLSAQITGPFVREPYPQYLADVMAKSVGFGLSALQTAAQLALSRDAPELAQLVIHSYRTEGT
jgi:hypothetical protein